MAVMTLAYIFSFVDRMIFGLLITPIRAEFAINDTVFSLLYGLGFAFFYTIVGVPLGWLADRYNRRNLAAIGIAAWSVMTAACGVAKSFNQLALARIAVGIGEATLTPATYSMAGDSFPPQKLGRALANQPHDLLFLLWHGQERLEDLRRLFYRLNCLSRERLSQNLSHSKTEHEQYPLY